MTTEPTTLAPLSPEHDVPVCTQEAARAAGLDIAPAPSELAAMAESIVRAWGDRWAEPDDETASVADAGAQLARAVPLLLAEREELLAELGGRDDEARERWVQKQLDETGLRAMDFRNGMSMDIEPARELCAHFVGAARAMLGDAPNYSETRLSFDVKVAESPELYTLVVQRHGPGVLTPHEARQKAERERDQHATLLRELVDLVAVAHRYPIQGGHDSLGADLTCAGCALADRARGLLATPAEGSDH